MHGQWHSAIIAGPPYRQIRAGRKALLPLFLFALSVAAIIVAHPVLAFSEYGDFCEDNRDCQKCRTQEKCLICIHGCENRYGSAEGFPLFLGNRERDPVGFREACRLTLAKWCQAQCWDPDNITAPSTKPRCHIHLEGEKREGGRIFHKEKKE